MAISFLCLAFCLIFPPFIASTRTLQHTQLVGQEVHRNLNESRRELGEYFRCDQNHPNPIDECSGWCNDEWKNNRKKLADCGVGYGKNAQGGKDGKYYVVTSHLDPDAVNPPPGTLRYGVLQNEPLWIVFQKDMTIELKEELIMTPYKTIDGRGVNVNITKCSGITVQYVNNIIINSVTIKDIVSCGDADVRSNWHHYGERQMADGDAISIMGSRDIWVNHCTLSNCHDGLIDMVLASTAITVSNCHFSDHNEVMLLGHNDDYVLDKNMKVTIAYNYFGKNLIQRMPRIRHGTLQLINNFYPNGWGMYAVGGTSHPTIVSVGNIFVAPDSANNKEVTFHVDEDESVWKNYPWYSVNDLLYNDATFRATGGSIYDGPMSMEVESPNYVVAYTRYAGA
ncbi:probable pectate lyase 22 [Phtheirospermum japonicum]|uniref:Pectate lyase n=1 Tax=Phtheirospermum japonicum TaxID=374723 RepID=A0A830BX75_9LAMI|nr:probable pectate lyase 22 [Phtheirospermum japonicum]